MAEPRGPETGVGASRKRRGGLGRAGLGLATALFLGFPHPTLAAGGGARILTIDAATPIGALKPLQGVNGVPAPGHSKPFAFGERKPRDPDIDVSVGYREAAIRLVRTHDAYGAGDIDARFIPHTGPRAPDVPARFALDDLFPRADADPQDPRSYNFGPTDRIIDSITAIGAEPLFRLGRSEGADPTPPADPARYAEVVRHIVLHYAKGWAYGRQGAVRQWEIWNEPDLGRLFWSGTPEQFYDLYDRLARAVKSADPDAKVGGPTLAMVNEPTPYREGFFDHVKASGAPFDFLSWHWYELDGADPFVFARIADALKAAQTANGLATRPQVLDEWNGGFGSDQAFGGPLGGAAFLTAALVYMQDSPIAEEALYRGDELFGADGKTPNLRADALIAHGRMQATPQRLAVSGADHDGFAVEAGRSADGRTVQVLIANYQIAAEQMGPRPKGDVMAFGELFKLRLPPRRTVVYRDNRGYALELNHLPRAAHGWTVERWRISEAAGLSLIDRATVAGGSVHLSADLPPPAVELIVLHAAD